MVKAQQQKQKASNFDVKQSHKSHKTIRQKLRKKRKQLKQHLKQKRQHKKQYNPEQKKREFFEKNFQNISTKEKSEFKYKKMRKYVEKFLNIYQDDLEDFFALFKQFDQGGFIDIGELENKKLKKLLRKMFKVLGLNKVEEEVQVKIQQMVVDKQKDFQPLKEQYQKKKQVKLVLETLIRNMVSQAIQTYLEDGTDKQNCSQKDSIDEQEEEDNQGKVKKNANLLTQEKSKKSKKKQKKQKRKQVKINIRKQQQEGVFTLPVKKYNQNEQAVDQGSFNMGPMIPQEERQKIAQLFEEQVKKMQEEKEQILQKQQEQFDMIFSSGKTASKLSADRPKVKSSIQDIPDHLLAEGSAKIGQKVPIADEQGQQGYNQRHRPKKLIEEHQEMLAINRGETSSSAKYVRKPFDRQRDIVNSHNKIKFDKNGMKGGVFFDFKDKMSVPKKSNNFL